jgi:hypothetical protein
MTARCAIEYPRGVFTPMTFGGGNPSGSGATLTTIWTDIVPVTIPANTKFRIGCDFSMSAGGMPNSSFNRTVYVCSRPQLQDPEYILKTLRWNEHGDYKKFNERLADTRQLK